ncbi:MAG: hypothetical protein L0Z50_40650 [Verrucomicrobiales bacterium]|nr:hypothetical protein [Verrucomicrobiales bacterium]
MKTKLILATAIATFALTGGLYAGDAALSPKAKDLRDSLRKVPGTTVDMIDRSTKIGSPKGLELAHSLRKVPSTGPRIDLAHGPRPLFSPKDPRYETTLREMRESRFEIAPLR